MAHWCLHFATFTNINIFVIVFHFFGVHLQHMSNLAYQIFDFIVRPIQRLPLKFHYFWGKAFTFVARDLMHYRRDVIITNLSRSFPEMKYKEISELTHDFYDHLGEIFAEAMYFGGCHRDGEKLHASNLCSITNPEVFLSAYKNSPSVMVMTSHFGNWELLGGLLYYFYGVPEEEVPGEDDACFIYKKLSSPFWDKFFTVNRTGVMSENFKGCIESKSVLRWALEHRNEQKFYVFPTDQFPYKGIIRHEISSFMGQKTYAMEGGTALARKLGMSILYMSFDRVKKGHYDVTFKEICPNASEVQTQDVLEKFYSFLEEDVKRNPANYLWSHKRWK